jgi:hypothetical protein
VPPEADDVDLPGQRPVNSTAKKAMTHATSAATTKLVRTGG